MTTCRYCGNRMIDIDIPPFDLVGRGVPARFCESCKNTEPLPVRNEAREQLEQWLIKFRDLYELFKVKENELLLYKKALTLATEDSLHWRRVMKVCKLEEEYFLDQARKELEKELKECVCMSDPSGLSEFCNACGGSGEKVLPDPKDKCHHCGHEEDFEWHSHGREAYCNKCGKRQ